MTPPIESFAALVPCDLLDRSGEVFYSDRAAFSTPSDVYLLGYNLGSDPSDQRKGEEIPTRFSEPQSQDVRP